MLLVPGRTIDRKTTARMASDSQDVHGAPWYFEFDAGQQTGPDLLSIVQLAGLDLAAVYGIGAPSPAGSGTTAELGIAMMLLAVVWFLFRDEVARFQFSAAPAVFGLPTRSVPGRAGLPKSCRVHPAPVVPAGPSSLCWSSWCCASGTGIL